MTKTKFSTWVGTSLLTSSLLLLPGATPTFAQTVPPPSETRPPATRQVETRDEGDKTGLWGLLGLAGLLGLTGLGRRRAEDVRVYTDPHERSRT
jgi:MYXO-CTERM domain-containing protein